MKKLILLTLPVAFLVSLTGCLKDDPPVDFKSTAKPIVELPYHGLDGLGNDAILTAGQVDPIVLPIVVNVASEYPLTSDTKFTLAIDDALRTAYNSSGGNQYEPLPDSTFSFPETSGTIKAGSRLDTLYLTVYPDKVDPTINYMLPIKIADASGETISGNLGVAYFHMIGNPIAGNYTWDWTRWNTPDSTTPISSLSFTGATVTFLPDNPTQIEVASGYYTGKNYIISFDNNGGVLSNFKVAPSAQMLADFDSGGITIVDGPTLTFVDPVAKHFTVRLITASRFLIDDYYQ